MRKLYGTIAALTLAVAGSQVAAADVAVPVDGDFNDGEISWTGGNSKSYVYVWDVIEIDGKIAVCGAGQFNDPSSRLASKGVMRKAKITMGGKAILTDLTFFTVVKKSADLRSAKATCRVTGAAVPKGQQDIFLETDDAWARF